MKKQNSVLDQLTNKATLRADYPRNVIVLASKKDSRPLRAAVEYAASYSNPSNKAEIAYSEGQSTGWIWQREFDKAKNTPNTFLVLEDGSVLQKSLTELHKDLKMIASQGGGLSFAHQSNALFEKLGAGFCVLADEPLNKLISHLEINSYLSEMNLLLPLNHEALTENAKQTAKELLDNGTPIVEVSKRMGLNRVTIHRWIKSWSKSSE